MKVTIACATSLDGKLATSAREPVAFTSRRDRARLHALRDQADAILVGGGTIRAEDPPLLPDEARAEERARSGLARYPVRAVVARTLDLPVKRALVRKEGAPLYVFTTAGPLGGSAALAHAKVLHVPSLREGLALLAREHGVSRVLAEGGGVLNASLLAEDLVDELELTICPAILGGASAPTLVDGPGFTNETLRRARLLAHEATPEGELFLRYSFR
jgi:5-amino-6-(5-phosphoribosylamino)uracil reductase